MRHEFSEPLMIRHQRCHLCAELYSKLGHLCSRRSLLSSAARKKAMLTTRQTDVQCLQKSSSLLLQRTKHWDRLIT